MMPYLENMTADISIRTDFPSVPVRILANRTLLESLVTNLAVNALRHNRPGGDMTITVTPDSLAVSNTSDGHPLDSTHIFNRFWKPSENAGGNGLFRILSSRGFWPEARSWQAMSVLSFPDRPCRMPFRTIPAAWILSALARGFSSLSACVRICLSAFLPTMT